MMSAAASSSPQGRTILVLDCEDLPKWEDCKDTLWYNTINRPNDSWVYFRAFNHDLPSVQTVRDADLVTISGSHYSAYEDIPWIQTLKALLPQYVSTGTRIVACCFGHQLLSLALGGKIGRNPSERFVLKVEDIQCDTSAMNQCGLLTVFTQQLHTNPAPTTAPTTAPAIMRQVESHGDCVLELPPGATRLAHSMTCTNEMYAYSNNVISFQFHPEIPPPIAVDKIWTALASNGRLNAEEAEQAKDSLTTVPPDSKAWCTVINYFADNGLTNPNSTTLTHTTASHTQATQATTTTSSEPQPAAAAATATAAAAATALQSLTVQDAECESVGGVGLGLGLESAAAAAATTTVRGGGVACAAEAAAARLVGGVRGAWDADLSHTVTECALLTEHNRSAEAAVCAAADRAGELSQEVQQLQSQANAASKTLQTLPQMEVLLDSVSKVVESLEVQSIALAKSVGAADKPGLFAWS